MNRKENDSSAGVNIPRQKLSDVMFEANPYTCIIFDDNLNLADCNPAAIEYFGFSSKEDLLENLMPLIKSSMPAFQPDASPTIPLSKRFDYVLENGYIEFEIEMVLGDKRVPLRFTLKKLPYGDSFVIAGYILDMQTLKEARNELLRQDFLMRQVNRSATRLMSCEPEEFDSTVLKVLKNLGRSVNASQMYIWENYEKDGALMCRELYTWNGDSGEDKEKRCMAYELMPDCRDLLSAKKNINAKAKELSEGMGVFVPRGTKTVMLIPVFLREGFWGFIGLNKSSDDNLFTNIEEKVIQSGGILVVLAILRNQINQNLIIARQESMASNKAKSDFLSRMSHEIRTPMNAIIGMTAIAKKTDDHNRIHYSLNKIDAASQQLLNIINDILDMSKIESGKFEISLLPFEFEKMMRDTFDVLRVKIDEKGQRFNFELLKSFDRYIICDELRLTQVMVNLVTNAVKFTQEGGSITVRADYRDKDGESSILRVEVIDDGIGISPKQQEKLFRSFEQADGSITRRFGGTGLGLAICKNITLLLGGDIWVESEEGKGSAFIFEVAFQWGDAIEGRKEAQEQLPQQSYRWPDKCILVVEDVEINREIITIILEETEIKVECAENGLRAVQTFNENYDKYDLILMDMQMPELDGLEATRQIRSSGLPNAGTVPILAMTANAFTEDVEKCLDAGMNDHIAKPVDVDSLLAKLASYLEEGLK